MTKQPLIIQHQRSITWYLFLGLLIISVLAVCFYIGRYLSVADRDAAIQKSEKLQTQLAFYESSYKQASEDLVIQAQHAKVDHLSNKQLVETIKKLEIKQTELKKELAFYRNIMAPELSEEGLNIQSLSLKQSSEERVFEYKLVLTQNGRQDQFLKGKLQVLLKGQKTETGKPISYRFGDLIISKEKDLKFTFRYFQTIQGLVKLPKGFRPESLMISAETKRAGKKHTAEKQFDWKLDLN